MNRIMLAGWLIACLSSSVFGQSRSNLEVEELSRFELIVPAMGTEVQMVVYAESEFAAKQIMDAGWSEIDRLTPILNNYDPESEICRLCLSVPDQATQVSKDLARVLEHSRRWHQLSEGKFDVTVGPLTRLWRTSRKNHQLPNEDDTRHAIDSCGWENVMIRTVIVEGDDSLVSDRSETSVALKKSGMMLDLSGIATGYIIDAAFEKMVANGSTQILINIGGDIRVGDAPTNSNGWRVQIAGLGKSSPPLCYLVLSNVAVTTSGDLNQYVEINGNRYSHFIDPSDGMPIRRRQSVTAIGKTTIDADAGATALAVLGMERSSELFHSLPLDEAVIVEESGPNNTVRYRHLAKE
jgi:FAD:protein FMN transferase